MSARYYAFDQEARPCEQLQELLVFRVEWGQLGKQIIHGVQAKTGFIVGGEDRRDDPCAPRVRDPAKWKGCPGHARGGQHDASKKKRLQTVSRSVRAECLRRTGARSAIESADLGAPQPVRRMF